MARDSTRGALSGSLYFAYAGCTVATILIFVFIGSFSKHSWDEVLSRCLIGVFGMTVAYAVAALARRMPWFTWLGIALNSSALEFLRSRDASALWYRRFAWAMSGLFVIIALALLYDTHRRYIGVIGILETCAVLALRPPMTKRASVGIAFLSVASWALAAGLTYTNFSDWALNSNASQLAVPAFVGSFGLVMFELCDDRIELAARAERRIVQLFLLLCFIAFSFRSDNLLSTWVPYHRSFFADPAQLVRDGHWLLWDVPSMYGFLSILAVAVVPAKNAWQGLFILSSAILAIQSCILFILWRWGRTGWTSFVFALLIALAAFGDGISRYPFGARLYPQGGLRFIWILGMLATVFFIYVYRNEPKRVERLYWLGHVLWLASVFWTLETGVWATVMWLPYLVSSVLAEGLENRLVFRLALRLWPPAVLFAAVLSLIEIVYHVAIGHGPDWFGFVEFAGLFASGTIHGEYATNPSGAGWSIVLVLAAVGSLGIASIRHGQWAAMQLLTGTWLAVWVSSTYFSVEPFDGHVSLLLSVLTAAAAIVAFISREALCADRTALLARLSTAPILILCISNFFGDAAAVTGMTFPLERGWTSDTVSSLPPISGELSHLITRAGIRPGDPVLIPNREIWTEISQGMLFPIAHSPTIGNVEYRAWAPLSPLGNEDAIFNLPAERRKTYVERFLDLSKSAGWYVEYRTPAACTNVSSRLVTVRTLSSSNFSVSQCAFQKP